MNGNKKKWVNPRLKSRIISGAKLIKAIKKNKFAVIYDMRNFSDQAKISHTNYYPLDSELLKSTILLHTKKEKILLISEKPRTYVSTLSWARLNGYKKIYLCSLENNSLENVI